MAEEENNDFTTISILDVDNEYDYVQSSTTGYTKFKDLESNISVRTGFNRNDYNYFRPGEATPAAARNIIHACNHAYKRVGLIRNTIDLMSDFTVQGMRLVHRQPGTEKFYRTWWRKVNGLERSERFANLLYRQGVVVAQRKMSKLTKSQIDKLYNAIASDEFINSIRTNELPESYVFLNPMNLEVIGENLGLISNKRFYQTKLTTRLLQAVREPRTDLDREIVKSLPASIVEQVRAGQTKIILNPDEVRSFYYKVDDWEAWASPLLYAILDDIIMLEKLKLADLTALDGAIQHIRLWKIGNLDKGTGPRPLAVKKLKEMLLANVGGGGMDIIWGPDIELQETSSDVSKYLGIAKYEPALGNIYQGLGIPATLTGNGGNANNNFISLKTLCERLNYGRERLKDFWNHELRLVQKAMGFRYSAEIVFDGDILTDEASHRAMLRDMADRNILSDKRVREHLGEIDEIEEARIRRENKAREIDKSSPFHNPNTQNELRKIYAQRGYAPSEVGFELEERKPGEVSLIDVQVNKLNEAKPKGQPGQGRPKGKVDETTRKKRTFSPQTSQASIDLLKTMNWALSTLNELDKIVTPIYLESINKNNKRQLIDEESNHNEKMKFAVLCSMEPFSEASEQLVYSIMTKDLIIPGEIKSVYNELLDENNTLDDIRRYQALAYATIKGI